MEKTYECCPHCDHEVELEAELKVQKCPNCGRYIVTCSMCYNTEEPYHCHKDCCLEVLAHKMNEDIERNKKVKLSDCVKEDLFMFYARYRDFIGAEEVETIYDTNEDLDLCLLAEMYGASNALAYKSTSRYWYAGSGLRKPLPATNIAEDIDRLIDEKDILRERWFWKEYVDLEKLENK